MLRARHTASAAFQVLTTGWPSGHPCFLQFVDEELKPREVKHLPKVAERVNGGLLCAACLLATGKGHCIPAQPRRLWSCLYLRIGREFPSAHLHSRPLIHTRLAPAQCQAGCTQAKGPCSAGIPQI